mmetsp:Transcript_36245/g.82209  ORF Transcript_36245/g.82209 Transcript_36245/m.82209 type:complete len:216 (-) Transcript_36245:206-853(-)
MTEVFSAIWFTIWSGSFTSVMITSETSTPCGRNWSLRVLRMSSATSRPFPIAAAACSASFGPFCCRSVGSPSRSSSGRSSAPFSTRAALPLLSVRRPYTSWCISDRATERVASSHASTSCCSRPRAVTWYTNLRTSVGSSFFLTSPMMRKTTARLICTVTLSCVLHPLTGMLKTTLCFVTMFETFVHGGPQKKPAGQTGLSPSYIKSFPKRVTSA